LPARRLILGLILAAVAQFLGLLLAGAGHGWTSPFFASVLLWILIPTTLLAVRRSRPLTLGMAAVALAADAWLIMRTIDEGNALRHYLDVNGFVGFVLVGGWIGLWFSWQGAVIIALLFGRRVEA